MAPPGRDRSQPNPGVAARSQEHPGTLQDWQCAFICGCPIPWTDVSESPGFQLDARCHSAAPLPGAGQLSSPAHPAGFQTFIPLKPPCHLLPPPSQQMVLPPTSEEKIDAIRLVQLSCPLSPPSPSAPLTHLDPASRTKLWPQNKGCQSLVLPPVSLGPRPSTRLLQQLYQLLLSPEFLSPQLRCPFPISNSLWEAPT